MFKVKKVFIRTSYVNLFKIEQFLRDEGEQLRFDEEYECVKTENNYYFGKGFTIIIESEENEIEGRIEDLMKTFDKIYQNGHHFYYKIED